MASVMELWTELSTVHIHMGIGGYLCSLQGLFSLYLFSFLFFEMM